MKILDELWYGNIAPFEQSARGDKRFAELLKLLNQNREELSGALTDKQKETLEKYEETMNEMYSVSERDAFSYGCILLRIQTRNTADGGILPSALVR